MNQSLIYKLTLVFLLGLTLACRLPNQLAQPGPPKVIKSTDGISQATIPDSWNVKKLHDKADLQAANLADEGYFIVLSEPKADLAEDITYQDHAKLTLENITSSATNVKILQGPSEMTINERPAVQYEVEATVDNTRVIYIHTTIDGEKTFHQLIAWTLPSHLDENRKTFNEIINSFMEIPSTK